MHYLLMEAIELGSMQVFVMQSLIISSVGQYLMSMWPLAFGLLISYVEVLDVQMMRALASTLVSVALEQHGTFVVLMEDILLDLISSCLEK